MLQPNNPVRQMFLTSHRKRFCIQSAKQAGDFAGTAKHPAPRSASSVKPPDRTPGSGGTCLKHRLGIVGRISHHHGLRTGEAQLSQSHTDDAQFRFPVLDVIAAGGFADKLTSRCAGTPRD
jgi:hypothetical protein